MHVGPGGSVLKDNLPVNLNCLVRIVVVDHCPGANIDPACLANALPLTEFARLIGAATVIQIVFERNEQGQNGKLKVIASVFGLKFE